MEYAQTALSVTNNAASVTSVTQCNCVIKDNWLATAEEGTQQAQRLLKSAGCRYVQILTEVADYSTYTETIGKRQKQGK